MAGPAVHLPHAQRRQPDRLLQHPARPRGRDGHPGVRLARPPRDRSRTMAEPGVVTDCIARFDRLFAMAEAGMDVTAALQALARDIRDEARRRGDLAAIIAGIELAAALSTPMDHPETPAERFLNRASGLLRRPD